MGIPPFFPLSYQKCLLFSRGENIVDILWKMRYTIIMIVTKEAFI